MSTVVESAAAEIFEVGQRQKQLLRVLRSKARAAAKRARFITEREYQEGLAKAYSNAIRLVERTT